MEGMQQTKAGLSREALQELFPIKQHWAYFTTSVVGPLSLPAYQAMEDFNRRQMVEGCKSWPGWAADSDEVRVLAASLLNCRSRNIAFVSNTAFGIWLASRMIDWNAGDEVIVPFGEFPANIYPWLSLEAQGVKVRLLRPAEGEGRSQHVSPSSVTALINERTRALSVSFVQYDDGCRRDVVSLGKLCRDHGIVFIIDAIQGLGALPLAADSCGADFIVSGGQKWLLSPPGIGLIYVADRWLEDCRVPNLGWFSVADPYNFAIESYAEALERLSPDARRLEGGTPNFSAIAALRENLKIILDSGSAWISARIEALTNRLVAGAESFGCAIVSPRADAHWSGIVSFSCPGIDSQALHRRLLAHGVSTTVRQGRLRVAVHFFNDEAEIDRLLDVVSTTQG